MVPQINREEVDSLLADYAWFLDTTMPEEFAALFAEDATLESPAGTCHGTDELIVFAGIRASWTVPGRLPRALWRNAAGHPTPEHPGRDRPGHHRLARMRART